MAEPLSLGQTVPVYKQAVPDPELEWLVDVMPEVQRQTLASQLKAEFADEINDPT